MLCNISKQSFPKLAGQLIPVTGVISGFVTPTGKTKSNSLPREKVKILSKSVVKFLVFLCVIKKREFSLAKGYKHQKKEVK